MRKRYRVKKRRGEWIPQYLACFLGFYYWRDCWEGYGSGSKSTAMSRAQRYAETMESHGEVYYD